MLVSNGVSPSTLPHLTYISRGTACGSPILLSNIIGSSGWGIDQEYSRISLRPSPFGQRQPAIPTAKSVTIARIANPFSIHRRYQTSSHNSLKSYFGSTKRLVKANDIIAVSLNAQTEPSAPGDDDGENHGDEWYALCREAVCSVLMASVSGGIINEIVYFLITNVEHSVIAHAVAFTEQDLYTGSTVGELGCWVDSSVTRMVQTGLEHARVPDVGSYFESGMIPSSY